MIVAGVHRFGVDRYDPFVGIGALWRRRRSNFAALACFAIVVSGCSGGDRSDSALADLLVQRYGGNLACVREVVDRADESTTDGLWDIARDGLNVDKWRGTQVLVAFGQIMAC